MKTLVLFSSVVILLQAVPSFCVTLNCTDDVGATYVGCPSGPPPLDKVIVPGSPKSIVDLACCNEYQYNGPKPQQYEFSPGYVYLRITALSLEADQKITIKSFRCNGQCKHLIIDSSLQLPFVIHILNPRFVITSNKGNTSMTFFVESAGCSCGGPCQGIYYRNPQNPVSGLYNVNVNGLSYEIYCEFKDGGEGCVYISKDSFTQHNANIDLDDFHNDNTKACLKFKKGNGQKDNVIEQLTEYSALPLSFQVNAHSGYQLQSHANIVVPPYIFLGLIPKNLISKDTIQGYNHNGNRYSFSNCDNNPNSYFAFVTGTLTGTQATGSRPWVISGTNAAVNLPDSYFYYSEEHQGGCGVYHRTSWVALGLSFNY